MQKQTQKKNLASPTDVRPTGSLQKPVFRVAFECNHETAGELKVAAESAEEAMRIGKSAILKSVVVVPVDEQKPNALIAAAYNSRLCSSPVITTSPESEQPVSAFERMQSTGVIKVRSNGSEKWIESSRPACPQPVSEPAPSASEPSPANYVLHPQVEVFDFRAKWPLVRPHLKQPRVMRALENGMNDFLACQHALMRLSGIQPSSLRSPKFDHAKGPWFYTPNCYWLDRAHTLAEAAMDRGEFSCRCANKNDLTPAERTEYYKFEAQFFPRPLTYYWYQCFMACHWLAPWLKELGQRTFPKLKWSIMKGRDHSLAYGMDRERRIRVIFDIINFDKKSARELIQFATRNRPNNDLDQNPNRADEALQPPKILPRDGEPKTSRVAEQKQERCRKPGDASTRQSVKPAVRRGSCANRSGYLKNRHAEKGAWQSGEVRDAQTGLQVT